MLRKMIEHDFNERQLIAACEGHTVYKFDLEELSIDFNWLVESYLKVDSLLSETPWITKKEKIQSYKGYGLTYNKNFVDTEIPIHHQVFGTKDSDGIYSQDQNSLINNTENTYFDPFGFRWVVPEVEKHMSFLLEKINGSLLRSRVAKIYSSLARDIAPRWHIDEKPFHMIRLIIPITSPPNCSIQLKGSDGYGNEVDEKLNLRIGKAYVWNNRVPHRICVSEKNAIFDPRVNIILGFNPWYSFVNEEYIPNDNYGLRIKDIVEKKLFIN